MFFIGLLTLVINLDRVINHCRSCLLFIVLPKHFTQICRFLLNVLVNLVGDLILLFSQSVGIRLNLHCHRSSFRRNRSRLLLLFLNIQILLLKLIFQWIHLGLTLLNNPFVRLISHYVLLSNHPPGRRNYFWAWSLNLSRRFFLLLVSKLYSWVVLWAQFDTGSICAFQRGERQQSQKHSNFHRYIHFLILIIFKTSFNYFWIENLNAILIV